MDINLHNKIKEIHKKGFNISMMINKFKKDSKLRVEIPASVLLKVCESFDKYSPKVSLGGLWPYFKTVLRGESEKYCISLQKEGARAPEKINKEGLEAVKAILDGIKIIGCSNR